MLVRFTQTFGTHAEGSTADFPDQVAKNLVRAGAAVLPSAPVVTVSTTEAYPPVKTVRRSVKKDL